MRFLVEIPFPTALGQWHSLWSWMDLGQDRGRDRCNSDCTGRQLDLRQDEEFIRGQ